MHKIQSVQTESLHQSLLSVTSNQENQMSGSSHTVRVLALYRQFFTATRTCSDRPLKLYIRRRTTEEFRKNINAPSDLVEGLITKAQEQLEVVKRQMAIRGMLTQKSNSTFDEMPFKLKLMLMLYFIILSISYFSGIFEYALLRNTSEYYNFQHRLLLMIRIGRFLSKGKANIGEAFPGRFLTIAFKAQYSQITKELAFTQKFEQALRQKLVHKNSDEFLRLEIQAGQGCEGFTYKFKFDNKLTEGDFVHHINVPNKASGNSEDKAQEVERVGFAANGEEIKMLNGATLDFAEELMREIFYVKENPNAEVSCSCKTSFSPKDYVF